MLVLKTSSSINMAEIVRNTDSKRSAILERFKEVLVLVVTLALRGCVWEVWGEAVVSGSYGSAMVLCRLVEHICDGRG